MKINLYKKIFLFILPALLLFFGNSAMAVGNLSDAFKVDDSRIYAENDYLDAAAYNMGYDVGRSSDQGGATPERIISLIINVVLSLLGVIFIVLMIYGGILWMTAGGNEQQVEKAKNIIKRAVVGLVIVLSAYVISIFVISIFINQMPIN